MPHSFSNFAGALGSCARWLTAVALVTAAPLAAYAGNTVQDFEEPGVGTDYGVSGDGGTTPTVVPGTDQNASLVMRIVPNQNTQNSRVVFSEPSGAGWNKMTVDFDFRFGELGAGGADGIGFALLDNTAFPIGTLPIATGEEPNFVNSFGIGLDTWDNGGGPSGDGGVGGGAGATQTSLSVHYNGAPLPGQVILETANPLGVAPDATILGTPVHLKTGNWGHAHYELTPAGDGSNVTVQLTTVENGDDQTTSVLENFLLLDFTPYDGHVYFAARTGNANENTDIDNVNVQFSTIPEPSSIVMVCMALAGLAIYGYRRRQTA
jgi:hypothetical protein